MKTIVIKLRTVISIFALSIFISNSTATAQSLKPNQLKPSITISGTSTLHDWESIVESPKGEYVFDEKTIKSLTLNIPVTSIKSKQEEKLMDKKTYEALDSDKNPTIIFQLTEPATPVISGSEAQVILTGNLTIAGITKKISIKSSGKKNSAGAFQFSGVVPLKMSDYKIKPPVAMLGLIKTGDVINIKFDVTIPQQSLLATY
ncbi:hypothetical protein MASR2M69_04250 [Bacteroidota bacterium]